MYLVQYLIRRCVIVSIHICYTKILLIYVSINFTIFVILLYICQCTSQYCAYITVCRSYYNSRVLCLFARELFRRFASDRRQMSSATREVYYVRRLAFRFRPSFDNISNNAYHPPYISYAPFKGTFSLTLDLPAVCSCGKANSVQHALSCTKTGFPIYRHNDIRDLTASLMEEVSTSTDIEPALQPLTGEVLHGRSANVQDDSRVGIRSKGFWYQHQDAFFDVRVFNPLASSNQNSSCNQHNIPAA